MIFKPYAYQRYCINRMITDSVLGLFLDMGLGKTVISLSAIHELKYNRFQIIKTLVIAPKKVAEDTWTREAGKWDHLKHLRVLPVLGSQTKRIQALATRADVYVINRENVKWLVDYYRNCWPFDMVVIDELSSFKNHNAKRFKALKLVRPHIKRIVGLTGTPAPNGMIDLWAQLYLLDQGQRLGRTISSYRDSYFLPGKRSRDMIYSYKPGDGAVQAIKNRISDICVSMTADDYLELPEKIERTHYVTLDSRAQAAYTEMERDMLLRVDETTIDAGSAAALVNKLLQICNGAVYDENGKIAPIHRCKLETLEELIEGANGAPVLVFYAFKHDLYRIRDMLAAKKLKVGELKDSHDIDRWNAGEIDVLLAHPASAAYGLNLQQGGSTVIWFGLTWSLELYLQANARLYRQGQQKTVMIHRLAVSGGEDEDVLAALEAKSGAQEKLVSALRARIRKYQADEKTPKSIYSV